MASVSLTRVIEKMKLENLTPEIDVKHVKITQPDINRPALQLTGFFDHFASERVQIIGYVEYTYHQNIEEEKKEKMYLINYFLEQFKGTLYRQTMFAEFEKITHEMAWNKEPLTAEVLCDIYYKLNQKYFGEDIVIDKEIALEWARIPHFYTPFYVYQYATGYSAAIAISRKILSGDERAKEGYFKFLSGGSSMNPIDLLRLCNVDMAAKEPIESALKLFGELLDEMEEML